MSKIIAAFAASAVLAAAGTAVAAAPAAVIADAPRDAAHPAGQAYVRIPSHGALLNGAMYIASGAGPHPTVLLLHGFPGVEENLDIAQAARRAGFNVMTVHYRGSWGSPGDFSFTHSAEDADAAVAFLRDPANAAKFGIDPARIFVVGHSMGGFMAASATAHDPHVAGVVMISAADLGLFPHETIKADWFREDVIPLAGCTPESLGDDLEAHRAELSLGTLAPALSSRPVLLVTADDGFAPFSQGLAQRLHAAGDKDVAEAHMTTDHAYSDHRIALTSAVVEWLQAHR